MDNKYTLEVLNRLGDLSSMNFDTYEQATMSLLNYTDYDIKVVSMYNPEGDLIYQKKYD